MEGAPLNQFDFYLRFAKPLVLNLAEPNERVLAAAWLQKLRNPDSGDEQLRTNYLKLLLFVLQRKRLAGPFTQNPGQYERLEQFPEQYKLQDIAKAVIEIEEEDRRKKAAQGKAGASGDYPPYTTEYSADLLEYTAAQDIPNFGVHVYYAISKDPLPLWDNAHKGIFPRTLSTGKIDLMRSPSGAASTSTLAGSGARFKARSRSRSRSRTGTPRRPSRGKTPPAPPLGVPPPPDERLPPTWGTNLIQVSEPPLKGFLEESFPDYEEPLPGELSGDLRFKGPSPQAYDSSFDISAYQPKPYSFKAVKKLDFDEDRSKIQHQPGKDIEVPAGIAEDIARINELLEGLRKKIYRTPSADGPTTSAMAPAAPIKLTKKISLTKRTAKSVKPVPKGKVVAKPPLFPPKPAKYQPPPLKKKVSKTTVKKTTTKGGVTTVSETVTTVEEPTKPTKQRVQQQKGKPQAHLPKSKIPAPPQQAVAVPVEELENYDMAELRNLGLTEADLVDINLDNLDVEMEVEDISDQEVAEYEEISGVDLYDEQITKQLDEYEKRIKELEEEYAEDIAMYGDQVGTSPIPEIADQISPHAQTAFRAPSSGAPSLPYRTPSFSPGFIVSTYSETLHATGMPSFVETSMTEQSPHEPQPILLTPMQQIGDINEDTSEAQFIQAQGQYKHAEADYMQAWLNRFQAEEVAAATAAEQKAPKISRVKSQTRTAPVVARTSQLPQLTPSKGAIKKVITKKTSKTKGGIKSVVKTTTTISQPAAPEGQVSVTDSKLPLPGSRIPSAGTKIPVPPGSKLPVPPSRIAQPAGSKLPQPGKTMKKTTTTTTRVVQPQPPLPLQYQVYDEELNEFRLMEAEVLDGLSKSQRQLEQLEAEKKRKEWLQSEDLRRETAQGQPVGAADAIMDQMAAIYSINRKSSARQTGQVYKQARIDKELEEYRAIEKYASADLSESQRQLEEIEAERRRNIVTSDRHMVSAQSTTSLRVVLQQMEALHDVSRMPVRESWGDSPLSEAPSLPYRTPPLPTKSPSKAVVTKTTTKKVTTTKGGVTTVKESKTIEKPKGPVSGSKIGIPKKGVPVLKQPVPTKIKIPGKPTAAVSKKTGEKVRSDAISKRIPPGTPASQAIIDEANQQIHKLDQLYKKYQLPDRRPDAERTPPVFSKYGEIRQAGAGILYGPEQFGLTEQEHFQPATEYFKDRKDFSPHVDQRRPIAEVLPSLRAFPERADWLLAEKQPDQEILEAVVTPTKLSPKQEIEEIMRDIEMSPTWAGLPVTTPKRSPSPRRNVLASVSPIMIESPEDKGVVLGKYGMPAFVERKLQPQNIPKITVSKPTSAKSRKIVQQPKPKEVTTEHIYTTTTTTQEIPGFVDGEPVTIVKETITTTREDQPAVEGPSTPPFSGHEEIDGRIADVYPDAYQSPPHIPPKRISPKRTPPFSAKEAMTLDEMEQKLILSSPEAVSPQLLDRGGVATLDELGMDMYGLPTSPQEVDELLSEQIEVVEETYRKPITEQQNIPSNFMPKERSPYMMVGKTRSKAYLISQSYSSIRSPIEEDIEDDVCTTENEEEEEEKEEEPFVYVTTTEKRELIEELEPDMIVVPSEQYPTAYVASPPQFGTASDAQLGEELRPVVYYDSPKASTPPPPKPPLPVMDPFLADVAYAEYPDMRKLRRVKRKPRVSPVMEDLEIEPESPTAPRIRTTPRRSASPQRPTSSSGTPIRMTRSKRVLKKRVLDFSQPEPGAENRPPAVSSTAAVINYDNLIGMEVSEFYEVPPRISPPLQVSVRENMQPQIEDKEQKVSHWQSPKLDVPGRIDAQKQQVQFIQSPEPQLEVNEYISVHTVQAPQETYSPSAQHGYTVSLDTESPGFVVEEEITEETVEELPALAVAAPPAPPDRWPTPPKRSPDKHMLKVMEAQQIAKKQYESLRSPSPHTPPKQVSVWEREDVEILESEVPEELVPPGSPPSPFSTKEAMQEMLDTLKGKKYVVPRGRKPVALYGYGERAEKVIQRKSKPSSLAAVPDDRIEPPDDYVYWPGLYQPVTFTPLKKVRSPNPLHPGHSRSPLYANLPPQSAKRRDVLVPSPTKGQIMLKLPPPREPTVKLKTPPALLAEGAIGQTPVSRYAIRGTRDLQSKVSSDGQIRKVQMRQRAIEEAQDPLKQVMYAVDEQLAALYNPPPPPIKTPEGSHGKRLKQIKRRLFTETESASAVNVSPHVSKSPEIVETVEIQEILEMPKEYSRYTLDTSPKIDRVPDIVDELEDDVEPAEVYYTRDPQASPAGRPKIRAPTPPPQSPPKKSPRMEYEEGARVYDEDIPVTDSPERYPPSPSEQLPSPSISYTPTGSPLGVDPRLKEQLIAHEYTAGFDKDERPYQRPYVRVGSRSQYHMGRRLPLPELDIVEEEHEMWPTWEVPKAPEPTAAPRQLQTKTLAPRPPSPVQRPKTPSPRIPTPPPLPAKALFGSPRQSPVQKIKSPLIQVPVAQEGMQAFTPPDLYGEVEEGDVAEEDLGFIRTDAEADLIIFSPELAPEPVYYYGSPTTQRVPSPQPQIVYSEGVPVVIQRTSPVWPQYETEVRPTAEQMMVAPSRSEQETQQVKKPKRLQFGTPEPPLQGHLAQQQKIGKFITPPPSTSKDTPPILQKRPQFVSPPSAALLASLFTPPEKRASSRQPVARTSPLPAPTAPWLPVPSVPSIEMDVVESATTVASEPDYEERQPFGGRRSPVIYDTSPMQLDLERSYIEDELKGFKWMDQ